MRRLLALFLFVPLFAFASVSNGTIDSSFKLSKICKDASCSSYGVLNFKPTINGSTPGAVAVSITDSGLTGTIWGSEIGWTNLAPSGAGVTINPTTGVLGGMAYAQSGGWINFAPTQAAGNPTVGVTVNSSGEFVGWAWVSGPNGGWLKFDCSDVDACVKTDWRPIPYRPATTTTTPPVGGGGPIVGSGPLAPAPVASTTASSTPPAPVVPLPDPSIPPKPATGSPVIPGSVKPPTNLPPLPPLTPPISTKVPQIFTANDTVQIFPTLRTIQISEQGTVRAFQATMYEFPIGAQLRIALPVSEKPERVTTEFRYIGPWLDAPVRAPARDTFWHRLLKFFLLAQTQVAYAAEQVVEDFVNFPTEIGVYDMYITIGYPGGRTERIATYAVIVPEGVVSYKRALFIDDTVLVPGATVSLYTNDPRTAAPLLWRNDDGSHNPQITPSEGTYAFIVPSGVYTMRVDAPGFDSFESVSRVENGRHVINSDVELICRPWATLSCQWDAKVLVLLLIMTLIAWYIRRREGRRVKIPPTPEWANRGIPTPLP